MFSKFDTNPQSDELTAADLYDAQGEWEAQQEEELSDFDPHRDFYAEMDAEPVMHLPNDLYMIFDDPDYRGEFTRETMDRVGVVDCDTCDWYG